MPTAQCRDNLTVFLCPRDRGSNSGIVGRKSSDRPTSPGLRIRLKLRVEKYVSVEHALLAVRLVFRLAQSDEVAEHEIVIGADAGCRSDDVAGSFGEIEPGVAIGVVAH